MVRALDITRRNVESHPAWCPYAWVTSGAEACSVLSKEREGAMQIGVHLPHVGYKAGPDSIRRAAEQAEGLGFDDVWVSEHIIVPKDASYPPSAVFYDPVLTLTWAAAFTKRVRLGTSVLVLPMRHPVPLAKELATLQNLSGGRLILGAGTGWMEAEFDALGAPFRERGKRMDEGIAMMKAVWHDDPVSFQGRFIPAKIDSMRMLPPPSPPIPIWIGGVSEAALARSARLDGWHGSSRSTPAEVAAIVARLRRDRPEASFTISMRVPLEQDHAAMHDTLAAYEAVGVQHMVVEPKERGLENWLSAVETFGRARLRAA